MSHLENSRRQKGNVNTFCIEYPQTLGTIVQNLLPRDLCTPDYNNQYDGNYYYYYYYYSNNKSTSVLVFLSSDSTGLRSDTVYGIN
jgi:hypothetical protein